MQALDKKRPKEEKEIAHRLRPLAKLQTAEDYENFIEGILCESLMRAEMCSRMTDAVPSIKTSLSSAEGYKSYSITVVWACELRLTSTGMSKMFSDEFVTESFQRFTVC